MKFDSGNRIGYVDKVNVREVADEMEEDTEEELDNGQSRGNQ